MKIKDLLDFNPEAEIRVVNTGMLYTGEISYGWDAGEIVSLEQILNQ